MNFPPRLPRSFVVLAALILLCSVSVAAQQARGTLRGLITDELGAAIVGASVTLTDTTGLQKQATTNGEGIYTFTGLPLGNYKLEAIAPGFTQSDGQTVEIKSGRQSLDITLKVTIQEQVTVGETPI